MESSVNNKCEKCIDKECTCKENIPLEEKNILQRWTMADGKFNLAAALLEVEKINKDLILKVAALEEAMMFLSNWYNKTQRPNLLVPESTVEDKPKIIL